MIIVVGIVNCVAVLDSPVEEGCGWLGAGGVNGVAVKCELDDEGAFVVGGGAAVAKNVGTPVEGAHSVGATVVGAGGTAVVGAP